MTLPALAPGKAKMIQKSLKKISATVGRARIFYRRWLFWQVAKSGKPIRVRLPRDLVIELHPRGQIPELLFTSRFEREEIDLITTILKPGMNVLDIGANVGLYSVIAGKLVGAAGKVWAFEPSSETSRRLKDNLSLNGISAVEVVQIALSDVIEDSVVLKRDPGYRDGDRYLATRKNMNVQIAEQPEDPGDMEIVSVTTLDHFFSRNGNQFPKIDFIKMDIEGGEFAALLGARQLLLSNPKIVMMFECSPQAYYCAGYAVADVFQYLRDLGFGLFCRSRTSNSWISDTAELKQGGNIWACRDKTLLPIF
jgi:FkbM family methyltransferase